MKGIKEHQSNNIIEQENDAKKTERFEKVKALLDEATQASKRPAPLELHDLNYYQKYDKRTICSDLYKKMSSLYGTDIISLTSDVTTMLQQKAEDLNIRQQDNMMQYRQQQTHDTSQLSHDEFRDRHLNNFDAQRFVDDYQKYFREKMDEVQQTMNTDVNDVRIDINKRGGGSIEPTTRHDGVIVKESKKWVKTIDTKKTNEVIKIQEKEKNNDNGKFADKELEKKRRESKCGSIKCNIM